MSDVLLHEVFFRGTLALQELKDARIEIEKAAGPLFAHLDTHDSDNEQPETESPSLFETPITSS